MEAREAYRVFTKEHGVSLSPEAMAYICKGVSEEAAGRAALLLSQELFGGVASVSDLQRVLGARVVARGKVHVESVSFQGGCLRYRALKERASPGSVSIAALKEGRGCTIFGMVRARVLGGMSIEDEDGAIDVGAIDCECFLAPGVCASFEGRKERGVFNITKILLPEAPQRAWVADNLSVLFFSGFLYTTEKLNRLKGAIATYNGLGVGIDAVVIMVKGKESLENAVARIKTVLGEAFLETEFVVLPGVDLERKGFYPEGYYQSQGNVTVSTNPSSIEIGSRRFLVGAFSISAGVKKESVVQGDYRDNIGRVLLSQASYNPFITYTDLSETREYSGMVIGEEYDSFVQVEGSRTLAVCGDFDKSEGQFLFYGGSEGVFEISTLADA
ncbi:hypothetical protein NEDG_02133 [Nematocida displodere]|uniref:DNA polymerase delta subunit 2 n=1 Tax=Nematocida displodere TaxID=1805483 RepID=A0A177EDV7_9MICR|nr:hypothetical protein NEDG_01443 [Nematocida displodere]OAG32266.1 hypothetical protein NEDG_02133 [Nematocida displodere]